MHELFGQVEEAAAAIRAKWAQTPRAGIILGTGLGGLADALIEKYPIIDRFLLGLDNQPDSENADDAEGAPDVGADSDAASDGSDEPDASDGEADRGERRGLRPKIKRKIRREPEVSPETE